MVKLSSDSALVSSPFVLGFIYAFSLHILESVGHGPQAGLFFWFLFYPGILVGEAVVYVLNNISLTYDWGLQFTYIRFFAAWLGATLLLFLIVVPLREGLRKYGW